MTECSKCGDCCEDIHISKSMEDIKRIAHQVQGHPEWPKEWKNFNDGVESARFALNVWEHKRENSEGNVFSCPRFDTKSRTCTQHAERPPVCSGFPWYGGAPDPDDLTKLPARCTFNADTRINLPIVRIN